MSKGIKGLTRISDVLKISTICIISICMVSTVFLFSCYRSDRGRHATEYFDGYLPLYFRGEDAAPRVGYNFRKPISITRQWQLRSMVLDVGDGYMDIGELSKHVKDINHRQFAISDLNYEFIVGKRGHNETYEEITIGMLVDTHTFSYFMRQLRLLMTDTYPSSFPVRNPETVHADFIRHRNIITNAYLYDYVYIKFPQKGYVFILNPYSGIGLKNIEALWDDNTFPDQADISQD